MDRVSSLKESCKTFVASQVAQNHNMIRTKFFSQTSTHFARFRNIGWVKSQHGSRKFTIRVMQNICCIIGRAKPQHDSHEISIPNINPPRTCSLHKLGKVAQWTTTVHYRSHAKHLLHHRPHKTTT